ncbi:Outer membrane protein assembly factor BamB [Sinobacterium norvegicum]|uniref:Outer membrane protein assembly factor BamB n=1 Tax=Sinobacterium norvegicum TaxID=1641715 RepID=A0ABM9AHF9_9GAMM|nr:outer membrane protein assembly factor BamB [Sinobacterium norvegicum]CAH0992658.1 Outer membrane protein assembly factor BamB [Sinobacterium norvegicum]
MLSKTVFGRLTSACFVASLLTISACSSTPEDESLLPAELIDFEATAKLTKQWSTRVGDGQGGKYNRLQPVIVEDVIYAASAEGEIVALNKGDGKRLWKTDLDEGLSGGVGATSRQLFVGSVNGEVIAVDALTGEEQWRADVKSEILAAPASRGNVVAVQAFDGNIYGLSTEDGSRLWRYDSSRPVLTLRASAAPVIRDNTVYAGLANGRVVALDLNSGQVRWEARVAIPQGDSEIERIVDVNGSPLVMSNEIYAISYQGRLLRIDRSSGRPQWEFKASSDGGLSEGFGNVYFSGQDGSIFAVNRDTGSLTWEQTLLANRQLSTPKAYSNYVIVGDFEGYLHVLSQVDGQMVARTKLGSDGIRADILSDGKLIYVFGNKGHLTAYRIKRK